MSDANDETRRSSAGLGSGDEKGGLKPALPTAEAPEVPLFRTWRGVYWFVFGCFVGVVVALTIFTHVYA